MKNATIRFFFLYALFVCGEVVAAPVATLETLLLTISEGEGRAIYDAFIAIPDVADTPEKQQKAFDGLSVYLGQTKYFVVRDWYPPEYHTTEKQFSYSEMASSAIIGLGEPGREGLVRLLTAKSKPASEHAAYTLCRIEASAIRLKDRPESKDFPPLDVDQREALETFLQQRGDSLPIYSLTSFYDAGFPTAAEYMHAILIASPDHPEKHSAAIYLGSYGYEPALDDFLTLFKETPDASLRRTIREKLAYFTDSERVTLALTRMMEETDKEELKQECQVALELVRLKAEWRNRQKEKDQ